MWPFGKRTARQKEIRRSKTERHGVWYRRVPSGGVFLSTCTTVATMLVVGVVLNLGGEVLDLRAGQTVPRSVTSRIDFRVEDKPQTVELRRRARDSSPNYYKLDVALLEDVRARLANLLTLAKAQADNPSALREAAARNGVIVDDDGLQEMMRLAALEDSTEYQQVVDAIANRLASKPLVEPEPAGIRRNASEAILFSPRAEPPERMPMTQVSFANDPKAVAALVEEAVSAVRPALRGTFRLSTLQILKQPDQADSYQPLYRFDAARTMQVADDAQAAVSPVYYSYASGDTLADAGLITAAEIKSLRAEHDAYRERDDYQTATLARTAGRTLLAALVVLGVITYLARYQPQVLRNYFRRTVSTVVLVAILAATRAAFVATDVPPNFAVGMQALATGLMGVVYPQQAVLAVCGGLAILITLATQESIPFFIVLLAVSGTILLGLRVVRYRGQIVLVGLEAAGVAMLATGVVGLNSGQTFNYVLIQSGWATGMTLMALFIVEGILPGIERLFRLSTAMTLLEMCDASNRLLRALAAEAPGTYNHSMMVGALAESAADAIGANGLLCRAGSYYHDIGKMNKPEYFVENQTPGFSRHDKLSPAMSLLVIIGHVKDGIEMAREYRLPAALRPFIPEHHGTTLVEYFYHAANKARNPNDPAVSDTEFRYPGPKPQSRETAVVMLCDSVEGAVRAMPEPTPNRIEATVSQILQKRLGDGQFDECDLTFRELAEIEKSLVKSLCGIYHARIVYPKDEEKSA